MDVAKSCRKRCAQAWRPWVTAGTQIFIFSSVLLGTWELTDTGRIHCTFCIFNRLLLFVLGWPTASGENREARSYKLHHLTFSPLPTQIQSLRRDKRQGRALDNLRRNKTQNTPVRRPCVFIMKSLTIWQNYSYKIVTAFSPLQNVPISVKWSVSKCFYPSLLHLPGSSPVTDARPSGALWPLPGKECWCIAAGATPEGCRCWWPAEPWAVALSGWHFPAAHGRGPQQRTS